jgi:hypothetical protein
VNQFEYVLLGDETLENAPCWKIQSTPTQLKSSQYSKSAIWIRKDNYAFARIDSYVKEEQVRRLVYSSFQNIQGIWTARETAITDLRRGSTTRLALDKIQYNVPLKDDSFTLQAIRRP